MARATIASSAFVLRIDVHLYTQSLLKIIKNILLALINTPISE